MSAVGRLPAAPRSGTELARVLAAERSGSPFLHWRDAGGALDIRLLEGDVWRVSIGRGEDADIAIIGDPQVSRTHAILERVGDEWTLVDDGLSRNGSFVNGTRVHGRQRLCDGDRIVVGESDLVYRAASPLPVDETVPADTGPTAVYLSQTQRAVLIALCRPVHLSESATPATNREIGDEVGLSVDAVKSHLRVLFERFGLGELPQNEKRARLVACVLASGVLARHDF
jgi:pSer/pThr/pTyr-binding forkhead associated (FHA) protein